MFRIFDGRSPMLKRMRTQEMIVSSGMRRSIPNAIKCCICRMHVVLSISCVKHFICTMKIGIDYYYYYVRSLVFNNYRACTYVFGSNLIQLLWLYLLNGNCAYWKTQINWVYKLRRVFILQFKIINKIYMAEIKFIKKERQLMLPQFSGQMLNAVCWFHLKVNEIQFSHMKLNYDYAFNYFITLIASHIKYMDQSFVVSFFRY